MDNHSPHHEVLTMVEVCAYLRIHNSTVRRLMKKGFPAFKIGSDYRFRKDQIDKWVKEQEEIERRNHRG